MAANDKCANEICRNKGCGNQFDTVPCDFSRTCQLFSRIPTESITVERREDLEEVEKMVDEQSEDIQKFLAEIHSQLAQITTLSEKVKELESNKYFKFFDSVSCLIVEGCEFCTKSELYDAIKKEWAKTINKEGG